LRIIVKGKWSKDLMHKIQGKWGGNFEVYSSSHYATITGNTYGTPKPIVDCQAGLDFIAPRFADKVSASTSAPGPIIEPPLSTDIGYELTDDIREILNQDWSHDRSLGIIKLTQPLWARGCSEDLAYRTAYVNPVFAEKMTERSVGSRGREYFRKHVWQWIDDHGDDYREKREHCVELRVILNEIQHDDTISHDVKQMLVKHIRYTLGHGDHEHAGIVRRWVHANVFSEWSDRKMQTFYTDEVMESTNPYFNKIDTGRPGKSSFISYMTQHTRMLIENFKAATNRFAETMSVQVNRVTRSATVQAAGDRHPPTGLIKGTGTSRVTQDDLPDDPALATNRLFQALLGVRRDVIHAKDWDSLPELDGVLAEFLPENAKRPSYWTKADYKHVRKGVRPLKKVRGEGRGLSSLVMQSTRELLSNWGWL
jgi:hypothetical protein